MISSSFKPKHRDVAFAADVLAAWSDFDNYVDLFGSRERLDLLQEQHHRRDQRDVDSRSGGRLLGGVHARPHQVPGFRAVPRVTLLVYMLPSIMLVIPLYITHRRSGAGGHLEGLIITNTTFTLPFTLWLMRAYFSTIPVELEEAAMIDGCDPIPGAHAKVVIPLALPGIVADLDLRVHALLERVPVRAGVHPLGLAADAAAGDGDVHPDGLGVPVGRADGRQRPDHDPGA